MRTDVEMIELEGDEIVKLYPAVGGRQPAEDEARLTRLIKQVGIEAPFVHEVVERDGRFGVRMDKVLGPTFLEWVMLRPAALNKLASYFAYEHHEMHLHRLPELPPLKEKLAARISSCAKLSEKQRSVALDALKSLPDGDHVLHGDLHPENVVVSLDGPVFVNWGEAAKGHYLADVAKSVLLMELGDLPWKRRAEGRERVEGIWDRFRFTYQLEYMKICNMPDEDLQAWKLPLAAAMLADDRKVEQAPLLELIDSMVG